jgi:uncharacterized radical SAM superfamily Fe-S cluster-containing enzyme
VTLVAAVKRGINDHELGAIVRIGVEHPAVSSVVFQPVTHSGRHGVFDPLSRLTNADVIGAVAGKLPEWFAPSDFVPVPCCFPTLERMFSSSATPGAERALRTCERCGIDLPRALRDLERKVFMVVAQDFRDAYTLNVRQLMKCCVAEIVPDGRRSRWPRWAGALRRRRRRAVAAG